MRDSRSGSYRGKRSGSRVVVVVVVVVCTLLLLSESRRTLGDSALLHPQYKTAETQQQGNSYTDFQLNMIE